MSEVTNLIITFSTLEDEERVIAEMKGFVKGDAGFHIVSVNDVRLPQNWYGGTKCLECNILIGAYKYLDLQLFLGFLRNNVKWEAPDLVQLIVKEEHDMKFRLIDLIES